MENAVTVKLMERLVQAAHTRRDIIDKELSPADFEKFVAAVKRVGELSVQMNKEGFDLAVFGMAADYYSRAIAYMAAESAKLSNATQTGPAQ